MAYEIMYEGDGFIRKGPEPKKIAGLDEQQPTAANAVEKPSTKPVRRRGGITPFRFMRLVFR